MSTAVEMMGGGLSAGAARGINGQFNTAVSAAGSTISDATALTVQQSTALVTTVAAGTGVRLPNSDFGDEYLVYNSQGVEALKVYPPTSSGRINQLSAGTAMELSPYTAVRLKKISATTWVGWLSA